MNDMDTLIGFEVESSAYWRRQKAEEFPQDADRNLRAAELLDRIAADLKAQVGTDLHRQVFDLAENAPEEFGVAVSDLTRQVGFYPVAETGEKFLKALVEKVSS